MTETTITKPARREFGALFRKPNGRTVARFRVDGRQHSKVFTTAKQAAKWLDHKQVELERGEFIAPRALRTSFEDGAKLIVADYELNERKSLDRLQDALAHLRPTFGALRLGSITADRIVAYVNARRADGAALATVAKECAALRRIFRLAVAARRLSPAQLPSFPRFTINNVRQGFLTEAEFRTLRAALDADVGPMIEFMYRTGWRKSEAQGLTWDRVDWEGGVVRLHTSKTGQPRTFPFAAFPDLDTLLRAQRARTDAAQRRLGQIVREVFHRDGRPIRSFDDHWRQACARAGVPDLVPHDLRRSAIRNLVRSGVPEQICMKLSGHLTRSVFDRYDIVDEADLKDGVKKLATYAKAQAKRAGRRVLALG